MARKGSQDACDDDENAENITNGNELDMNIERSSDEIHLEIGIQGGASYKHNNSINVLISLKNFHQLRRNIH